MNSPLPTQLNIPARYPEGTIDLHVHTTHSDGHSSPQDVVRRAASLGLRAIAVTDHDTVSALQETAELAVESGIELVPGVEVSAYTEENGEAHILGYFIDPANRQLIDTLAHRSLIRQQRIEQMIARLQELGGDITADHVWLLANGTSIGRPHLARAMVQKGMAASIDDAFDRYLAHGKAAFVAKDGFSYRDAIQMIVSAGGVPVYAHPGLKRNDCLLRRLIEHGIRGLEVFHSEHSADDIQRYQSIARENGLVITGGSDCHGANGERVPLMGTVHVPYALLDTLRKARSRPQP